MVPAQVTPKGLSPGEIFGRYVIEALLGTGGMASVYRARDTALGRVVALKVLRPPGVENGEAPLSGGKERIQREARALAALEHPNVVAVYDVGEVADGEHAGTAFLTMELVKGRSLRSLIRAESLVPIETGLRWLTAAARGLAAAHQCGVVHRDVKPENILVRDDGVVKVLDFGIAKSTAPPRTTTGPVATGDAPLATITGAGIVIGTPYYMSPEQMRGERVDARSDQFSWAVVAFQILTGSTPWGEGLDGVNLVARVLGTKAPDVRDRRTDTPSWLAAIVARALEKDPEARFASMDEIAEALDHAHDTSRADTEMLHAASEMGAPVPLLWKRIVWAAALLALGAFVLAAIFKGRHESPQVSPLAPSVTATSPAPVSTPSAAREVAAAASVSVSVPAPAPMPPPAAASARHRAARPPPSASPPIDPFGDRK